MELKFFDVEHGACALLTTDNGRSIMIDCGHNTTTGWKPGDYLLSQQITSLDMLVITNYDEDHASGLPNLLEKVEVKRLLRNKSVSPQTLTQLKSQDGMGAGISRLIKMAEQYTLENLPEIDFQGVEREVYY